MGFHDNFISEQGRETADGIIVQQECAFRCRACLLRFLNELCCVVIFRGRLRDEVLHAVPTGQKLNMVALRPILRAFQFSGKVRIESAWERLSCLRYQAG